MAGSSPAAIPLQDHTAAEAQRQAMNAPYFRIEIIANGSH
jgi:hypothetical protein